jgi:hypothetical protein
MGMRPATMVGELPLVSSVEQDKWCTLHNRQPWALSLTWSSLVNDYDMPWNAYGKDMGTWEQGNYHWLTSLYHSPPSIYLWRKVVFCFVLFVLMRSTELGCFRSCSWSLWKALNKEGASAWFHGIWTCGCRSSWILNDFFTEIFGGIGMCLWCCWKDLDEKI